MGARVERLHLHRRRGPDGGGFREDDAPNFSFRTNHCSFYSGTKALGEEVLAGAADCLHLAAAHPVRARWTARATI